LKKILAILVLATMKLLFIHCIVSGNQLDASVDLLPCLHRQLPLLTAVVPLAEGSFWLSSFLVLLPEIALAFVQRMPWPSQISSFSRTKRSPLQTKDFVETFPTQSTSFHMCFPVVKA
jgi:hypothetical protein